MWEKVYTKAPRPVGRVVLFDKGRFRRVRDGSLTDDPERRRDPMLVLIEEHARPMTLREARLDETTITRLEEDGRTIATGKRLISRTGKRRPELIVYIIR